MTARLKTVLAQLPSPAVTPARLAAAADPVAAAQAARAAAAPLSF